MITTLDDYNNNKNSQIQNLPQLLVPTTSIQVYFDGLCQPYNPGGTACYSFIINNEEGYTIHSKYGLAAHDITNIPSLVLIEKISFIHK